MIQKKFINPFGYALAFLRLLIIILTLAFIVGVGITLHKLGLLQQRHAFTIRSLYCKWALFILGVRVHKSGKLDLTPGTLYVGNHRSLVDPIVVFAYLTNGYAIGKVEVSKYPLINTGAMLSGVIYVDRDCANSRKSTREAIADLLSKGMSVLVFPEGTISTEVKAKQFRQGTFHAAAATKRPIVTFALEMGDPGRDFWYGDGLFNLYFQSFSKWRTEVYLHFFEPILGNSGEELTLQAAEMVGGKLEEFQKNWK
ncbi:MAG: 1-acyl-sn-glycerol-3-phosphate acyltransferase [Saprospiraceae bacterium]|nr:1-acyl-sn-glycerol-3-phosphate acyltransferase [Saprospiraceae bacterium]